MEVICNSTNASGPDIPDGSITIFITGGTPPYTILWENGSTTNTINNLLPGTYTVTVTDYYGDYTITITCIVGSDSFYITKFTECCDIQCYYNILTSSQTYSPMSSNQTSYSTDIYVSGVTTVDPNLVYTFQGLDGCYEFHSNILWSGETYSALTIQNTYIDCDRCIPEPTPPVVLPTLCLQGGGRFYEFTPNTGVDSNGYYTWTDSTNGLTLSYNVSLSRWEITPWSPQFGVGVMIQNSSLSIPTGTFVNLGNTNATTWIMNRGECPDSELGLEVIPTPETCKGDGDGAAILNGTGGLPPYQYRIQGVLPYPNYSSTGVFTNLLLGNYLGEVLDNNGDTYTSNFTIPQGQNTETYNLNVVSSVVTFNGPTKTWNYTVQIPNINSLSSGQSILFDLSMTHTRVKRDSGTAIFSSQHEILKNGTTVIPYNTSSTNTYSNQTSCPITTNEITEVFTESVQDISFEPTDTSITGEITMTVIIDGGSADCGLDCRMVGEYTTELEITNVRIQNISSCQTVGNGGIKNASEQIYTYECFALP
jgi:hypothetical protein